MLQDLLNLYQTWIGLNFANDVRWKLYMVGIHLTVGKRAKRMPDTTVETTKLMIILNALSIHEYSFDEEVALSCTIW